MSEIFDLIGLTPLMENTMGDEKVIIGLIDGPYDSSHLAFKDSKIKVINNDLPYNAALLRSYTHSTALLGILAAKRSKTCLGICPGCKYLMNSIFNAEESDVNSTRPSIEDLAEAIILTINNGAKIINLSLGLSKATFKSNPHFDYAIDYALKHDVLIVLASGNQGYIGRMALMNNPWIIPVGICDIKGQFDYSSNINISFRTRGVLAPGINIISATPNNKYSFVSGSSVSAAIVSGIIGLLWSLFPEVDAKTIKTSLIHSSKKMDTTSLIPKVANAYHAWKYLKATSKK